MNPHTGRDFVQFGKTESGLNKGAEKIAPLFNPPPVLSLEKMLMYPFDEKSDTYTMSAYLIAQLGKNYSEKDGKMITGAELLGLAWDKIKATQYMFGGMVTFLEAENEEKLLSFYRESRFSQFDTRQTTSDTDESHELVQLLRLL